MDVYSKQNTGPTHVCRCLDALGSLAKRLPQLRDLCWACTRCTCSKCSIVTNRNLSSPITQADHMEGCTPCAWYPRILSKSFRCSQRTEQQGCGTGDERQLWHAEAEEAHPRHLWNDKRTVLERRGKGGSGSQHAPA